VSVSSDYMTSTISSGDGEGRGMALGDIGEGVSWPFRSKPVTKGLRVWIRDTGEDSADAVNQRGVSESLLSWSAAPNSPLSIIKSVDMVGVWFGLSISSTTLIESPRECSTRALNWYGK